MTGSCFIQSLCEKLDEAPPLSGNLEDGLSLESILKGGVQSVINTKLTGERNELKKKIESGDLRGQDSVAAMNFFSTLYQTIRWEVSLSKSIHFHKTRNCLPKLSDV